MTIADAVADDKAATAFYVDGLNLTTPLDQTNTVGATTGTTTAATGNITTTTDNQLLIGAVAANRGDGIITQDADFESNVTSASSGSTSASRVIFTGDRIISTAETNNYEVTFSLITGWAIGIASYTAASTGTGQSSATLQAMRMK